MLYKITEALLGKHNPKNGKSLGERASTNVNLLRTFPEPEAKQWPGACTLLGGDTNRGRSQWTLQRRRALRPSASEELSAPPVGSPPGCGSDAARGAAEAPPNISLPRLLNRPALFRIGEGGGGGGGEKEERRGVKRIRKCGLRLKPVSPPSERVSQRRASRPRVLFLEFAVISGRSRAVDRLSAKETRLEGMNPLRDYRSVYDTPLETFPRFNFTGSERGAGRGATDASLLSALGKHSPVGRSSPGQRPLDDHSDDAGTLQHFLKAGSFTCESRSIDCSRVCVYLCIPPSTSYCAQVVSQSILAFWQIAHLA